MNEGQFIALRSYLEEHSSLLRQLLEAQKQTNEILSQLATLPASVVNSEPEPATKTGAKKGKPGAKPNVNWNS